ncbi:MAG: hypothetical protein IJY06_03715 [Oscillospiraceae bacterium]|nr:hypothetical protein [Oscillospiraceae bacterium]
MNIKKLTAAAAALAMLCGFSVLPASAEGETTESTVLTETEENGTVAAANALAVNTPIQGNSSSMSDKDFFKLELTEDGKLDFNFTITEAATEYTNQTRWTLRLYDENGAVMRTHNITGSKLIYNLNGLGLNAGTYYLSLTPSDSKYYFTDQTYTLTAKFDTEIEYESEYNDTLAAADLMTLDTPIGGSTPGTNLTDYFKLVLEEDAALDVTFSIPELISTNSNEYWKVYLYAGDSGDKIIQSMSVAGNSLNHKMRTIGLGAGTYYVKVVSDDDYYYTGSYSLTAAAAKDKAYESEFNNSFADADDFAIGTPITGNIHAYGDEDYYKIDLTEDAAVRFNISIEEPITTSTNNSYWYLDLYNDNNSLLGHYTYTGNTTSGNMNDIGLKAGTYYYKIYGYSSSYWSAVPYTITVTTDTETPWELENNDTLDNASTLELNTPTNGIIYTKDDVDYYKFELKEAGGVSFHFDPVKISSDSTSNEYWGISICYENGNAFTAYAITGNKLTYNFTTLGLDAGTYYIRIQDDDYYAHTQYVLTAATVDDLWETESNGSLSEADDLAVNTPINGKIHASKCHDYFKLTLPKGGVIDVNFAIEPYAQNDDEYWQLSLMNENGDVLQTKAVDGVNALVTLGEYEVEAGTYYISVVNDSSHWWGTKYTVTANFTEDASVPGDVNEDGNVDAADAAQILVAAAKIGTGAESGLTEAQELTANVNGDAAIDATDAAAILAYAAAIGSGNEDAKLEDFI